MPQMTNVEVRAARGYRVLGRTGPAWAAWVVLGVVGTVILVNTPLGSIPHVGVILIWTLYLLSTAALARTRLFMDGTTLHVQGRLRRRELPLDEIRQFATNPSGDVGSVLVFVHPVGTSWIWTVTMMRRDGTEEDLPVIGSKRACRDVAVELNRRLGR